MAAPPRLAQPVTGVRSHTAPLLPSARNTGAWLSLFVACCAVARASRHEGRRSKPASGSGPSGRWTLKRNIWRHSVTCADTPDTALGPRFHRLLVVVIGGQWLPSRGLSADYLRTTKWSRPMAEVMSPSSRRAPASARPFRSPPRNPGRASPLTARIRSAPRARSGRGWRPPAQHDSGPGRCRTHRYPGPESPIGRRSRWNSRTSATSNPSSGTGRGVPDHPAGTRRLAPAAPRQSRCTCWLRFVNR